MDQNNILHVLYINSRATWPTNFQKSVDYFEIAHKNFGLFWVARPS